MKVIGSLNGAKYRNGPSLIERVPFNREKYIRTRMFSKNKVSRVTIPLTSVSLSLYTFTQEQATTCNPIKLAEQLRKIVECNSTRVQRANSYLAQTAAGGCGILKRLLSPRDIYSREN